MAKKKEIIAEAPKYPKVLETFYDIGDYELNRLKRDSPACFNGIVTFKRYRITVELIDEPDMLYAERLEKLWVESDNHHNYQPLAAAARSIGYIFQGEHGCNKHLKSK